MKKTYLKPETACLEMRENQPLLEDSATLPVYNGGTSGSGDDDDVDDPDDLLAKPTTIYVAWDDDDLEI